MKTIDNADLQGHDYGGQDLSEYVFEKCDLQRANFDGAQLYNTVFSNCNLQEAVFHRAKGILIFENCDMRALKARRLVANNSRFTNCYLYDAWLLHADLSRSLMHNCDFTEAKLRRAVLANAEIVNCEFTHAALQGCVGDGHVILSMQLGQFSVTIHEDFVQIGCQGHTIHEWRRFDEHAIHAMNTMLAVDWDRQWRPVIEAVLERRDA